MTTVFLLLVGGSLAILLVDLVILLKARKKLATGSKEAAAPYDNFSKLTEFKNISNAIQVNSIKHILVL
ncbi:hypothetical protein LOB39_03420 [Lactobacillus delbrueckii subsp. sunkii]|uniref:Uncharacterized protein n=1 Tax=Lactobacillus delbrueckii subsp. allosunkii TaxID=1050107 RepID=A0ABD4SDG0_9LACO|nr:hypothetical protein [Lactobacillus delbrueckii]MCD5517627.1 hypothetical protein [Lactobacillus delbrueckii subsp. sunkii]